MPEPTHVCTDCGALGYAGGYHDHGGGEAGETIALAQLPDAIRSLQGLEQQAREAQAARDTYREALDYMLGGIDREPWVTVYRDAGGGYEGLQAVARAALEWWTDA